MWKRIFVLTSAIAFFIGTGSPLSALPIQDRDEWSGTYFMGKKLGFNHAVVKVDKRQIQVDTQTYFRLEGGGIAQVTTISQTTRLSPDLKLKSFTLLQEIMGNRQRIEARMENGQLKMDVTTRGRQREKVIPFGDDVVPASTVWLNILRRGLKVGDKGRFQLFIEPFQTLAPMDYEIVRRETLTHQGKPEETWVVAQRYAGMDTTLWVNSEGSILKEKTANGFEAKWEPKEVAQSLNGEPMSVSSFITLSLVKPQRPIKNPYETAFMKFRLDRVQGADSLPEDHRQKILKVEKNGKRSYALTLQVRREPSQLIRPASFPLGAQVNADYLKDTGQIQSNHATIQKLARTITDGERDPWKVALNINHWVYITLKKEMVDSFTALDALENGKGECQSHTNLFTAIARAAGIPTRVVNGLVYSNEYKGFLYHAWPEVYVGEWRALDPTLGQDAVDATHIKLSEGNYEGALKLMEFIGKVEIELLENQ